MSPNWDRILKENNSKGNYTISDEERKKRSERAKELVKQGKIGGKEIGQLGGRPRVPKASEMMAEAAEEHFEDLKEAVLGALKSDNPFVSLQAAKLWFTIEQYAGKSQIAADDAELRKFNAIVNALFKNPHMNQEETEEQIIETVQDYIAANPELAEFFEREAEENDTGADEESSGSSEGT